MSLQILHLLRRRVQDVTFHSKILPSVGRLETSSSEIRTNEDADSEKSTVKETFSDMPIDMPNPFEKEKPKCILCKFDVSPNFKNVRLLSQFVSPFTGRTYGRHITGLCKAKQDLVEKEIIKAQSCGFMSTYFKNPSYLKDPKIFDPENPVRPHRF